MGLGIFGDVLKSFLGQKEKGGDLIDTTPKWLQELGKSLGAQVNSGLQAYTPGAAYGGNLNFAGKPTDQEQSSLDLLTNFLGSPGTGSNFDAAEKQINDTLSGKFADPNASPFIKAMSQIAKNNLNDDITAERGRRGSRGSYFTDSGIQAEGKLRTRTQDTLNGIIGQFQQNERQNMLGAADTARGLDEYKNLTVPIKRIAAGQTYGSLSRTIEQANLESQYADFLRQRKELSGNADTATQLAVNQQQITPGQVRTPTYMRNNDFGNILDIFGKAMDEYKGSAGQGGQGGGLEKLLPMLMSLMGGGA